MSSGTTWPLRWTGFLSRLSFVLGLCLVIAVGSSARAQASAVSAAAATPQVSPAEAKQLLGVLNDDSKRKQFTETLQNLVKAQSAEKPKTVAGQPLRPDSLGADVLGGLSVFGNGLSHAGHAVNHTISGFATLKGWVRHLVQDPAAKAEIFKILLRVAAFLVLAFVFYLIGSFLIRHPRHRLIAMAKERWSDEQVDLIRDRAEATEAADRDAQEQAAETAAAREAESRDEMSGAAPMGAAPAAARQEDIDKAEAERDARLRHQSALARLMTGIRRSPFSLGRLFLDLIPAGLVVLSAFAINALDTGGDTLTNDAVQSLGFCGGAVLLALAVFRAVLSPEEPSIRLMTMSEWSARFVFGWFRLIALFVGVGLAALTVLHICTLPTPVVVASAKILALIVHILIAIMILRCRGRVLAYCRTLGTTGFSARAAVLFGHVWWVAALFFDFGLWLVWAAEIQNGYAGIWTIFLRSVVALVIVRLIAIAAYGLLERGFREAPHITVLTDEARARLGVYYPVLRRILSVLIFLFGLVALAIAWRFPLNGFFSAGALGGRMVSSILTILVALLIVTLIWEVANIAIERRIRRISDEDGGASRAARIKTLQPMMRILLMVVLGVILGLTILSQIGIDTGPLLAGASIFGVALGFGSQKLVQDFINGIFLLVENALTVGDFVTLNGTGGTVEHLSLRTVHIRGNDGSMNIFPFSSLGQITNYNRDWGQAMIEVGVGYDADTDDVVKAIQDIGAELREDPAFKDLIVSDFQLWGVDSLGDSSVVIKGVMRTVLGGRWPVQREYNRRMKKVFEARGITIPFPIRTLEIDGLDDLVRGMRGAGGENDKEPPKALPPTE